MTKSSKKKLQTIRPVEGWVLITREESDADTGERRGPWHLAWMDVFGTKHAALGFAADAAWQRPYRAVRGSISVRDPQ